MRVILAVNDLLSRSRLQQAARAAGWDVTPARSVPDSAEPSPDLLVVDLDERERAGSLDALASWRAGHRNTRVVGFAFHANRALMDRAQALGVEVVTHGATGRPERLFAVGEGPGVS